jgi:hypothetical protein
VPGIVDALSHEGEDAAEVGRTVAERNKDRR